MTNLGSVSKLQVILKGTWGQPDPEPWDGDRRMHKGHSNVLPQPVLSPGAAGSFVGWGRSQGMSEQEHPQLHEGSG